MTDGIPRLMLCLIATACGDNEPTAAPSSGYAGHGAGPSLVHLGPLAGVPTIQSQPLSSRSQQIRWPRALATTSAGAGAKTYPSLSIAIGALFKRRDNEGEAHNLGWERRTEVGWFTSDRTASGTALFFEIPGAVQAAAIGPPRNSERAKGLK